MSLISEENMHYIVDSILSSVSSKIYNKDISSEQKEILDKSDILKETEGYSLLCNDGTYKDVYIDKIEDTEEKTDEVTELFDVTVTTQEEKWETKLNMPTKRYEMVSSVYEDKIYVIGGLNSSGYVNKNECYNIFTNTWDTKLNMPTSRNGLTSCIYEDKIYCIGGGNDYNNSFLNKNECYNVSTNTWETKLNMPTSRATLTSCIYRDKIYCIGGYSGYSGSYLNKNECYNISTNTWETKLNMPTKRYKLTSSIYEDKIYCIGGGNSSYNYIELNECYNVSTDTWETKLDMPTKRNAISSSIYKNKIYCIGGYNGNYLVKNECYDVSTNTWETKLDMPTKRYGLISTIYEDKIYVIGGSSGSGVQNVTNECYYIENSSLSYNVSLPDNLGDKLEYITTIGDGSKVLSDNGTYVDIPKGYRFMEEEEVNRFVDDIMNYRWNSEV